MKFDMSAVKQQLIENISCLIEQNSLKTAEQLINEYESMLKEPDVEVYSMKAIIAIKQGFLDKAESILVEGIEAQGEVFDLLYNLAYVLEQLGKVQRAIEYYEKAATQCNDAVFQQEIEETIERIEANTRVDSSSCKSKVVFFVKEGMDSFLDNVIRGLAEDYETKKIIVTERNDIDQWMEWADFCWFEWCDELIEYGSNHPLAKVKKLICRIHGYEVYGESITRTFWPNVNQLIVVTPHILRIFLEKVDKAQLKNTKIDLVYCGVDLAQFPFKKRQKGFNIGYLGYINFKKNIPLTLDIFYQLYLKNPSYKLYLAGAFQDERTLSYLKFFVKENGLEQNVFFEGWKNKEEKIKWLEKIDYMLIASIDEGLCYAAAEGMASGIKPVLHLCEGLKDHYLSKYLFKTQSQAIKMIVEENYDSYEYRDFIEKNYCQNKKNREIKQIVENIHLEERGEEKQLNEWELFKKKVQLKKEVLQNKKEHELKRILIMTPSLGIGGAEEYTLNKAQWLCEQGYSVIIISRGGEWVKKATDVGVKHYTVEWIAQEDPDLLSPFVLEERISFLKGILIRENIDIIEGHNTYPAIYAYILSKRYGVPYFIYCLNTIDFTISKKYVPFLQEVDKEGLYYIGAWNANAEIEKSNNIKLNNCKIIRLAVKFIKKEWQVQSCNKYCLTVARMVPMKSYVVDLIQSFSKSCLAGKLKDYSLIIVGDGPLFAKVKQLVDECNSRIEKYNCIIEMKGFVYGTELEKLYCNCDVFIGSGLSALHATAYGKPTILVTHYPYDTSLGYGYLTDPDVVLPLGDTLQNVESKDYGEYMHQLRSNATLYKKKAQECYDMYEANYNLDVIMEQWVCAFKRIMEKE